MSEEKFKVEKHREAESVVLQAQIWKERRISAIVEALEDEPVVIKDAPKPPAFTAAISIRHDEIILVMTHAIRGEKDAVLRKQFQLLPGKIAWRSADCILRSSESKPFAVEREDHSAFYEEYAAKMAARLTDALVAEIALLSQIKDRCRC